MADVRPFRAVRYARPTEAVVAPPYDVISPAQHRELAERDPHNVVNVTLGEPEEKAGRLFRAWLEDGTLVRDDEPSVWALAQDYVGPDGVARTRHGVVASLRADPYEAKTVLPHEATHAGPKEGRLRLLRAARAQVEPLFFLHDGSSPVSRPEREPDLELEGTRIWRLAGDAGVTEFFADRQLLIADGHHRYETALAYAAEAGTPESARLLAVLVSTADPGLEIFATHRVFGGRPDIQPRGEEWGAPARALERLAGEHYERGVALAYADGTTRLVRGEPGELDVELVDRLGHEGISYTPDWHEAVRLVDEGSADIAFLLRPTRIEDVFERARRGVVMPPKTTYFFPKLLSGLLFHPLEP